MFVISPGDAAAHSCFRIPFFVYQPKLKHKLSTKHEVHEVTRRQFSSTTAKHEGMRKCQLPFPPSCFASNWSIKNLIQYTIFLFSFKYYLSIFSLVFGLLSTRPSWHDFIWLCSTSGFRPDWLVNAPLVCFTSLGQVLSRRRRWSLTRTWILKNELRHEQSFTAISREPWGQNSSFGK